MQRYHTEKIISTYKTRDSEKRRENVDKTFKVLEEIELERKMNEAFEEKNAKILNEEFYNHVSNERKNRKAEMDHSKDDRIKKIYNENLDTLCKDLFFYVVYESLLIDENIKSKPDNFNYVRESCNEFFDVMSNNNRIRILEGSGFDELIETANRFLTEDILEENPIDLKNIIKKTIISEDFISHYAIGSIKAKTAECLQNEKKATIIKENLINEDKYVDKTKTLFRYLFENNIEEVIKKSDEKDPHALQDLSMVETILDYTILEAANTLQLVDFNNELKKMVNMPK